MTKLNRSETVTVRMDPRMSYLCELAGRAQRRTKSSFIEWAVQEAVRKLDLEHCPYCGGARDRDGAEGGDANAAPVLQDRQARAEGIAMKGPA